VWLHRSLPTWMREGGLVVVVVVVGVVDWLLVDDYIALSLSLSQYCREIHVILFNMRIKREIDVF
jgi:hypothetical protein